MARPLIPWLILANSLVEKIELPTSKTVKQYVFGRPTWRHNHVLGPSTSSSLLIFCFHLSSPTSLFSGPLIWDLCSPISSESAVSLSMSTDIIPSKFSLYICLPSSVASIHANTSPILATCYSICFPFYNLVTLIIFTSLYDSYFINFL